MTMASKAPGDGGMRVLARDVEALRSAHAERLERLEAAAGVLGGVVGAVDGTPLAKLLERIEWVEAGVKRLAESARSQVHLQDRVGNTERALAEAQQRLATVERLVAGPASPLLARLETIERMHATWQDVTTKAKFNAHQYPVERCAELERNLEKRLLQLLERIETLEKIAAEKLVSRLIIGQDFQAPRSAGHAADAASYAAGPSAARLRAARQRAHQAEAEVTRLRDILSHHGIES